MGNVTAKTSGDIASFMTPAETNIKSLKVHFSPKQLGEGDPSPENVREIVGWDGVEVNGCGKNIAHIVGYSAINSDSNNSRTISNEYGTTINTTEFSLPDTELVVTQTQYPNTSSIPHYQNGYLAVLVDNLIWGQKYNVSFKINNIINNPLNVDLKNIKLLNPYGTFYSSVVIDNNRVVFKNVLWKQYSNTAVNRRNFEIRICGMSFTLSEFMVTPIDEDNFEYEPYKGDIYSESWTKNLLDIWEKPNGYTPSKYTNGNYNWSKEWIITDELRGKTVTYSAFIDNTNVSSSGYVHIWTKDSEGNFIKTNIIPSSSNQVAAEQSGWSYVKLTLTSDIYSVVFGITIPANATAKYPMVELGSEPTEYQPYVGTVYGGYVDLISGELVEEWKYLNLDNLEWYTTSQVSVFRSGDLTNYYVSNITNFICNKYTTTSRASTSITNMQDLNIKAHDINDTYIYIKNTNYIDVAEFKSNLIDCNMVYLLQEPITHQLTPTQLSSFIGQNNFWSNADYVEIEYDLIETIDIQKAKQKIILNQPQLKTISNKVVSFNTDMVAPIKNCKIYFNPIQEGSSDPSPTNIRNINGWTGLDSYVNGDKISVDWTSDAGTVYGGYLDLAKGEVVATYALFDAYQNRSLFIQGDGNVYIVNNQFATYGFVKPININESISTHFKAANITTESYPSFSVSNMGHFAVRGIPNITDTVEHFTVYVEEQMNNNTPVQFVMPLITPVIYQLTSQQLLTIKGWNNYWSNIDTNLEIKYWSHKISPSESNIAYVGENLTFNGTVNSIINTGIYLFNEENINRDFEVVVEGLYGDDRSSGGANTVICAKHNGNAYGFLVRINNNSNTAYNGTIAVKINYNNSLVIKRINGVISVTGELITNPQVKFTNTVHQWPLVLGCAINDDGTYYRFSKGSIKRIIVRWL